MAQTWGSLGSTLATNVAIGILVFIAFNVLRNLPKTRHFYAAKRYLALPRRFRPPKLSSNPLTWWLPVLKMTDEQFVAVAGTDALLLIQYLRLGCKLSLIISVICLGLILPVNLVRGSFVEQILKTQGAPPAPPSQEESQADTIQSGGGGREYFFTEFDKTSLANIKDGSNDMFIHLAAIYLISALIMWAVWRAQKDAIKWRIRHLSTTLKGAEAHTCLVQEIPGIHYGLPPTEKLPGGGKITDTFNDAYTRRHGADLTAAHDRDVGATFPIDVAKSVPVPACCELELYRSPSQKTDFQAWYQVQAALESGMSLKAVVEEEFKRTYPEGSIERVRIVPDLSDLQGSYEDYNQTSIKAMDWLDSKRTAMRARKPVKSKTKKIVPQMYGHAGTGRFGQAPTSVDEFEYWEFTLNQAHDQLLRDKEEAVKTDSATAFVTFKSRLQQAQAVDGLQYHNEDVWATTGAPEPRDVLWDNINMRAWQRTMRSWIVWALFILMLFFFMIPVAAVQSLLALRNVDDWPGVDTILDNAFLKGLIQGVLPGLALRIFLKIVPKLLRAMQHWQGAPSRSEREFRVEQKYYIFQFYLIFLVQLLAGSLADSAEEFLDDPVEFLKNIGSEVPKSAVFFLNYLNVQAFISSPFKFLRVPKLIIFLIKTGFAGSARARRRFWACQFEAYGDLIPDMAIAFVFLFVFSVMQPFVAPACFAFFACNLFCAKYSQAYVFREQFQSGGAFWPVMMQHVFTALLTFQVLMAALLAVKEFPYASLLVFPILATIAFWFKFKRTFDRPFANLSFHAAADIDRADDRGQHLGSAKYSDMEVLDRMDAEPELFDPENMYVAPAFWSTRTEFSDLMKDLQTVKQQVKEYQAGAEAIADPPAAHEGDGDGSDSGEGGKGGRADRQTKGERRMDNML